jgi:hypothetical protein
MTMTTHVAILRPVGVMDLFHHGRSLLGAGDSITWAETDGYDRPGTRLVGNHLGQGLPGIWDVEYRPDGPLRAEAHDCDWDDEAGRYLCATEGETFCHRSNGPACALEASIDTAYGWHADNGAGCGDLHAWFVTEVAKWCAERGAAVRWYAGEVTSEYEPVERLHILGDAEVGRIGSTVPRGPRMPEHEAFGALVARAVQMGLLS